MIDNPDVEIVWDEDMSDIDPSDTVDLDSPKALGWDPVGYVKGYSDESQPDYVHSIRFACGGHTHLVGRRDAERLARSIYDEIEGGEHR